MDQQTASSRSDPGRSYTSTRYDHRLPTLSLAACDSLLRQSKDLLLAMAAFSRFAFLAIAVIFHLVYIYSIFDIYFVSPIVSGMRLHGVERPPSVKAPADRLVLFVGMAKTSLPISNRLPHALTSNCYQVTDCAQTKHFSPFPNRIPRQMPTSNHGLLPPSCGPKFSTMAHLAYRILESRPSPDRAMSH